MQFKTTNYIVLEEGNTKNSVIAQVRDLADENVTYNWKEFKDNEVAKNYLDNHCKGITIIPWVLFSRGYKEIFKKITELLDELLEENKFSLLLLNPEKIIERIKLIGVTVSEEIYEDYETVYAYNLHFLIKCDEKVYVSHQIIYSLPLLENESDKKKINKVVPLFQNASFYDDENREFVVKIRDNDMASNPFALALNLMSGIGEETVKKIRENDVEDRIVADFLELINLPLLLKHKNQHLWNLKKEYYEMYLAQQKTL